MSLSRAESTLTKLCNSTVNTLCVDDSMFSDNMLSSSHQKRDGEVTDSVPCLMSHILIGCGTMDTSNMKTTHLPDVVVTICSGLIPWRSLKTSCPVSLSITDATFHARILNFHHKQILPNKHKHDHSCHTIQYQCMAMHICLSPPVIILRQMYSPNSS